MEWLLSLFAEQSVIQAIVLVSLLAAIGIGLGKVKIFGVSLGVTFVFFAGIVARSMGAEINPVMLSYAESFGLILFVYALGLQVGPGFFSSLRRGGLKLNILAVGVVLIGSAMTYLFHIIYDVSLADMLGVLSGSVTNTPALGAAQQTLRQLKMGEDNMAMACAVAYPFGVVGVILALSLLKRVFRGRIAVDDNNKNGYKTYISSFEVHNPGIFDRTVKDIASLSSKRFVISRLWRDGKVTIPTSETSILEGDHLLIISSESDVKSLTMLFGEQENIDWNKDSIDWNAIDNQLISCRILVTRSEINGKKLGALRLRNHYGINITRVYRAGMELMPTSELTLQLGDRLTIVGESAAIANVENVLGNKVKRLKEPNLIAVFIGIVIGLILGSIPFSFPGIDLPVKLGIAGGPIIVGILIGAFGPRLHVITYTTQSANLMLRGLGLSIYLACLGLDAGKGFFTTVFTPQGVFWLLTGVSITLIPIVVMAFVSVKILKLDYATTSGMLCGSMCNPMALGYANGVMSNDSPSVSYATVYPLTMFLRVIIAQLMLMLFI